MVRFAPGLPPCRCLVDQFDWLRVCCQRHCIIQQDILCTSMCIIMFWYQSTCAAGDPQRALDIPFLKTRPPSRTESVEECPVSPHRAAVMRNVCMLSFRFGHWGCCGFYCAESVDDSMKSFLGRLFASFQIRFGSRARSSNHFP